jgi:hypothetical protein
MIESTVLAYRNALEMKGAEFVVHLKRMLFDPQEMSEENRIKFENVMEIMRLVSQQHHNSAKQDHSSSAK